MPAGPQVNSATSEELRDIKDQIKRLEDRERQNYLLVIEGQRKTMDWWFSFLTLVTAVLAIFGALIPYLMGRKDKEIIREDKKQIEATKIQIESYKNEVESLKESIEGHERTALTKVGDITAAHQKVMNFLSAEQVETAEAQKTQEAVKTVQKDPSSDPLLKVRAVAIQASQAKEAPRAHTLWSLLAEIKPEDASAHFNAGYWAHELAQQATGPELITWLNQAKERYARVLQLKPDLHGAANNWGNVLAEEARAVAGSDLAAARGLWQAAGTKYAEALELKPDYHEAANNWGTALAREAQAVAGSDLAAARRLWREAGEKYAQALELKPDCHEAANNWGSALVSEVGALPPQEGEQISLLLNRSEEILLSHASEAPGVVAYNLACVYSRRGDVARCVHWLKMCQTHGTLPDCTHLRTDRDLDALRAAPEFIEWFQSVCPE